MRTLNFANRNSDVELEGKGYMYNQKYVIILHKLKICPPSICSLENTLASQAKVFSSEHIT